MDIDYAPPRFVTLDNARAIFYFMYIDLLSRYDMAYRGYKENIDIVTRFLVEKSENKAIDEKAYDRLMAEKIRAIFQHPIETFTRSSVDVMFRIYHPLIFTREKFEQSRAIKTIDIPNENLWDNCGHTCVWFPGRFSKLKDIEAELFGFKLPAMPDKTTKYFRENLSAGTLRAFLLLQDGDIKEIPEKFWNTDVGGDVVSFNTLAHVNINGNINVGRVIISAKSIVDLYYAMANQTNLTLKAENSGEFDWKKSYNENGVDYIKDIIDHSKLLSQEQKPLVIEKKVGAPEKYDKTLFLAEAFKYMWFVTKSVPDNITELAEAATRGYVEAGGLNAPPSDKWAWNMASDLWKRMGFKGGEPAPE